MEERQLTKLDILKKLSPGTVLRAGLDDIVRGKNGALIVVCDVEKCNVFEGGFEVNTSFTSKKLAELAKMDGAIILSEDFKTIAYANTLLVPDRTILTIETGTRHQAAERIAKQLNGLVIAVSERMSKITIYYQSSKFVLQESGELLRRATETLQILEKQREIYDELLGNLNILEITGLVSIADICSILQRMEMIKKMADIINNYIVALGNEGVIVRMRMREIIKGIDNEESLIIKDYNLGEEKTKHFFNSMNFEELLDSKNLAECLFTEQPEIRIIPKGYRILSKSKLKEERINQLIEKFVNLENIFNADVDKLRGVVASVEDFRQEISSLREQIMVGKKI